MSLRVSFEPYFSALHQLCLFKHLLLLYTLPNVTLGMPQWQAMLPYFILSLGRDININALKYTLTLIYTTNHQFMK